MSNTSPSNESTRPPDSKVCSSGAPSNSITNVVASSSVETNLEEQIATQITGQSEPQSSSKDGKKEGEKKRPAAEINGSKQSEEPAKKVKTAAAQQGETAGVPATTSNIPGRMAGGDSLGGSQDLMTRRRRSTRSRRVPDNQGKHEPYTRPGTKFRWADNGHIDTTQSKPGPEDKSRYKLVLKDTKGEVVKYHYTRRKEMDWSSKKDVAHLNTWRNQIIKRKLNKNDDGTARPTEHRPHWSEKEKISVEYLIRDRIRKKRRQLEGSDWISIAERHNARFRGVMVHVGEKLPGALTNKGKLADSKVLRKAHVLADRTATAIRSQANRWPETVQMVEEEFRKLGIVKSENDGLEDSLGGDEDFEGEREGEEGEEGEDSGDEIDSGLEDPSDDEDEGRRPASTQTGARPILAAS